MVAAGAGSVPQRFEYASGWQNWQSLGGLTGQTPSVVRRAGAVEDVFVTGTDNALYHTSLASGGNARTRFPAAPNRSDAGRL